MISKRAAASAGVAAIMLVVLVGCVFATSWDGYDSMHSIDYGNHDSANTDPILDDNNNLSHDSLNYKIFEEYGPLLIVLAILMFGAMVGGICVAREEDETDDTD